MGGVIIMRYNAVVFDDIANGRGVGVSLYIQGCSHFCPGCFNPETWDFNYGKPLTSDVVIKIIKQFGFIFSNKVKYLSHFFFG